MLSFPALTEYTEYTNEKFHIDIYENFITDKSATALQYAIMRYGKFKHAHTTKTGALSRRRNKIIYGDEDFPYYSFAYMGKEVYTKIHPWTDLPPLKEIRNALCKLTGQAYHVCVIQLYNNGKVCIDPHRDKEMTPGTIIASVSLGETRTMRFERRGAVAIDISLPAGSLCLLQPPTNDHWLHSIPRDDTVTPRISLVFRNCENMRPPAAKTGAPPKSIL